MSSFLPIKLKWQATKWNNNLWVSLVWTSLETFGTVVAHNSTKNKTKGQVYAEIFTYYIFNSSCILEMYWDVQKTLNRWTALKGWLSCGWDIKVCFGTLSEENHSPVCWNQPGVSRTDTFVLRTWIEVDLTCCGWLIKLLNIISRQGIFNIMQVLNHTEVPCSTNWRL